MTPQEIATLTAAVQALSGTNIVTLILVLLVLPWLAVLVFTWLMRGMIDKFRDQSRVETEEARAQFNAAVKMYEDNAALVRSYERLASDQQDLIIANTTAMQRLYDRLGKG